MSERELVHKLRLKIAAVLHRAMPALRGLEPVEAYSVVLEALQGALAIFISRTFPKDEKEFARLLNSVKDQLDLEARRVWKEQHSQSPIQAGPH